MNKIKEKCSWCGEDLSCFQKPEFENKLVNCPKCNNQYLVEDEEYYYSYLLRKCLNGKRI